VVRIAGILNSFCGDLKGLLLSRGRRLLFLGNKEVLLDVPGLFLVKFTQTILSQVKWYQLNFDTNGD